VGSQNLSTSPIKIKKSKWFLYAITLLIIIATIIVELYLLLYVLNPPSKSNTLNTIVKLNLPNPEVISEKAQYWLQIGSFAIGVSGGGGGGITKVYHNVIVDATVRNNGGEGWVKIVAEVWCGKYEKQEQKIYMKAGETQNIRFTFSFVFDATDATSYINAVNIQCPNYKVSATSA